MKTEDLKPGMKLVCFKSNTTVHQYIIDEQVEVDVVIPERGSVLFKGTDRVVPLSVVRDYFEEVRVLTDEQTKAVTNIVTQVVKNAVKEALAELGISKAQSPVSVSVESDTKKESDVRKMAVTPHTLDGLSIFRKLQEPITKAEFLKHSNYQQWHALRNLGLISKVRNTVPGITVELFRINALGSKIHTAGIYYVSGSTIVRTTAPAQLTAAHVNMSSNGQSH